jgi:hypothetical protein
VDGEDETTVVGKRDEDGGEGASVVEGSEASSVAAGGELEEDDEGEGVLPTVPEMRVATALAAAKSIRPLSSTLIHSDFSLCVRGRT